MAPEPLQLVARWSFKLKSLVVVSSRPGFPEAYQVSERVVGVFEA